MAYNGLGVCDGGILKPPARGCASCVLLADVLVSILIIILNNFKYVNSFIWMGATV